MSVVRHNTAVTVGNLTYVVAVRAIGEDRDGSHLIHIMKVAPELLDLLARALPYVEEAAADPAHKHDHVARLVKQIYATIASAENRR